MNFGYSYRRALNCIFGCYPITLNAKNVIYINHVSTIPKQNNLEMSGYDNQKLMNVGLSTLNESKNTNPKIIGYMDFANFIGIMSC